MDKKKKVIAAVIASLTGVSGATVASAIIAYEAIFPRVNRPDYSSATFDGIPVFDSVKSIQPVELIPLSRSGGEPVQTVIPSEPITLYGGVN